MPHGEQRRAVAPLRPLEWLIASDVTAIDGIVEGVVALCSTAGFSARQCRFNIPVALTEALSNAILRGNRSDQSRRVHVRSVIEAGQHATTLLIDVTDEGEGFDLANAGSRPSADDWLDREDGRGVFLMQSLMDHVECSRSQYRGLPGSTVRLVLHRA